MREILTQMAPRLRRYAHILLGSRPNGRREREGRACAGQEADDLVQQALLGFWRAGVGPFGMRGAAQDFDSRSPASSLCPDDSLKLALYRRVTALARQVADRQAQMRPTPLLQMPDEAAAPSHATSSAHMPWAPESHALPQLPFDLRALIALVAVERLGYEEAAEALDLPTESVLPRLAVARARLAGAISGEKRRHLCVATAESGQDATPCGEIVNEGELLRFCDDLLDRARRDAVLAFLESRPDAARRVGEWRRNDERLRRAFEPLMREPLPPTLNFHAPSPSLSARGRQADRRRGLFSGLATFLAMSAGRAANTSGLR